MYERNNLHSLGTAVGAKVLSLSDVWDSHKDDLGFPDHTPPTNTNIYFFEPEALGIPDNLLETSIYMFVEFESGGIMGLWVDPKDPYGFALINQDYKKAEEIAENRIKDDPKDHDAIFQLAYAKSMSGKLQESTLLYKEYLQHSPDSADAYNNIAINFETLGLHDKAHDYYLHAAKLAPNDVQISLNLANSYLLNGDIEMYLDYLETALSIPPSNIEDHVALYNHKQHSDLEDLKAVRGYREWYNFQKEPEDKTHDPHFH